MMFYGPMQTLSLGESKYFFIFVDDYSRMTWVYFLKEKSEVFECFKQFKVLVEKQSGCSLLTLRTDCGGEFTSTYFNDFYNKNVQLRTKILILLKTTKRKGCKYDIQNA